VNVLGINGYDHDTSACLLRDGAIVAAVAKERITRVKHDSGFFSEPVDYVLAAGGITLDQVDLVVRNCYVLPTPEMERRLLSTHAPYHMTVRERERAFGHPLFLGAAGKVAECSHHLAHAYSAFAASPFEEGAVMVVDGVGGHRCDCVESVPPADEAHPHARESESYYAFRGGAIETVKKVFMGPGKGIINDDFSMMEGLGALYSRVSTYVFGHWDKCGEVMGLAPYGRPLLPPLLEMADGVLRFHPWPDALRHPFTGVSDASWERSEHRKEWEDLAWRIQEDAEKALLSRARWLHEKTGAKNLCIAGGVGLNCVANGRLLREGPFERIFVQPAAGDDGIALGCALYGHLALRGGRRPPPMTHAYLGRDYPREEGAAAVRVPAVRIASTLRESRDVTEETAALLAAGSVVGWFQGRSEFGPRSLGNRAILADPRDPRMKDRVNARVKHRQSFRPFAPVVLFERAHEFFEGEEESPFMLLVKRVRPEARARIPAVVHVDGTARVQTLREEQNPRLHALLRAFERRTGVPVLLNTSFNIRGDPIVETPDDAVECFLYTQLDALVVHDWIARKRAVAKTLSPFLRLFVNVRRNLRSQALLERAARSVLESD